MTDLLEDLFKAYYGARKGTRNTINQLRFEMDMEENLVQLYHQLKESRYEISPCVCFINEKPVKREIFAADFRDRIIHHLLYNYMSPLYERFFIEDSYSCRKGKGTLFGIKRLEKHIRSCSCNYKQPAYVLTLDLQGYFMSIDKRILYSILTKDMERFSRIKMPGGASFGDSYQFGIIDYLLPLIVFHDPLKNCKIKGSLSDWDSLPPDKSLFHSAEGCGLSVGNLTSQLFANVYMNGFDHFVKQTLKLKYYGRYVDDFYIVHPDRQALKELVPVIRDYLSSELGLRLHPNKIVLQPHERGTAFLGAMVKPYRRYILNHTKNKFIRTVEQWNSYLEDYASVDDVPEASLFEMRASVNSYLGMMRHFRTFKLKQKVLLKKMPLYRFGYFTNGLGSYKLKKNGRDENPKNSKSESLKS
jgi:retron-type reverse transcriptase